MKNPSLLNFDQMSKRETMLSPDRVSKSNSITDMMTIDDKNINMSSAKKVRSPNYERM